jgi:CHAT domain-containing protein
MRGFYSALADNPPERAAAISARRLRLRHPHPADWASFLMIAGIDARGS